MVALIYWAFLALNLLSVGSISFGNSVVVRRSTSAVVHKLWCSPNIVSSHVIVTIIVDWLASFSETTVRVRVSVAIYFVVVYILIKELGLTVVISIVVVIFDSPIKICLFSVIIRLILK